MSCAAQPVRWWRQATPIGEIAVAAGPRGVERIELPPAGGDPFEGLPEPDDAVARELDEYFAGERRTFGVTVNLSRVSAPFRRAVLDTLRREVRYGETVTYGELAAMTGNPGAARAVGTALARNPVPLLVPCHRVVAADGIGGYGGGREARALKRALLDLEQR